MDLEAYIGAKLDEAVSAYDNSTESVKENIETIDDALAVSEERQKWIKAIENIKADINGQSYAYYDSEEIIDIIDKHTRELMK